MANYSEVEEDLLAQQEEEEARAAALEEQKQQERMAQGQQPTVTDAAKDLAKNYAKTVAKDFTKEQTVAAASAVGGAIVSTAPIWAPILGVIVGIVALTMFVIIALYGVCNPSSFGGWAGTLLGISKGAGSILGVSLPDNVCGAFSGGASGGAGATGTYPAPTAKLDIVLTSAYRPGPPSADSRGETVDIALRNPTDPLGSTDPRINQLIQIIQGVGFVSPQGYIQNEYTNPSGAATGGHIHVQFNLKSDGTTYCDGTKVPNPPTDLVPIPSSIPMSGVSHPELRPCMLAAVEQIFSAASSSSSTGP